jgi:hypothetical protein
MRGIAVFAAVILLVGLPGGAARARNGVRIGAAATPCLSADDDPGDDPEEVPNPHGTLPDDGEGFPSPTPPSTEPSSPEDDLPSEPAAAHPPVRPAPPPSGL